MKKPIAANAVSQPVAGADADRRGGDRYRTVWRIAKVTRDGDVGLWRVRNMSDRGMMLAADVLKQLAAEQRASGYRQPRLPVHTRAKVTTEEGTSDIELVDLSQSGAGFVHDGALEVGKEVDLALASGIHRKAIVRWARGTRGGLWLTQPLDRADLESIRRFQS